MELIAIHPSVLEIFRNNLNINDLIRLSQVNRWFYYEWIMNKRNQKCLKLKHHSVIITNAQLQYKTIYLSGYCAIRLNDSLFSHTVCYPCWLSLTRTNDFISLAQLIKRFDKIKPSKVKRYWTRFVERRKFKVFIFCYDTWYKIPEEVLNKNHLIK